MSRYSAPAAPCCENPSPSSGRRAPHSLRGNAVRVLPSDSMNRNFLNPLTESAMIRVVGRNLLAAAAALLVAGACRDAQSPEPEASLVPGLPLPGLGAIVVSTVTTGSSLDPDGYTVTVDNGSSQHIATNGVVTFTGLSIGNHTVTLSGVAPNCSVNNTVTVTIPLVGSGSTTFTVNCVAAPPPTGNLTVSTSTTGSSLDPDGYTVTLDGNTNRAIPANGSVTFSGLSAGSHTVVLSGVAGNCTVSGGTSRTVNVT